MAANDEVNGRDRPPEILPIQEALAAGTPSQPVAPQFATPFFLQLEQERQAYIQGFGALRQRARQERIRKLQSLRSSRVVVYYSVGILEAPHSERLQDLLSTRNACERLDLLLLSPGGYADAAYKMISVCRAAVAAGGTFNVLVPYYAKSAATLLCLGADALIMGPASEIGPIDPRIAIPDQYGRVVNISATSIRDALDLLEERAQKAPELAILYTPLLENLDLNIIGEYERALKSSEQYAEALLKRYMLRDDPKKASEVGSLLARGYYSHGYAIGPTEARNELGLNVEDASSDLWDTMWQLHKLYDELVRDSQQPGQRITTIFETQDLFLVEYGQEQPIVAVQENQPASPSHQERSWTIH